MSNIADNVSNIVGAATGRHPKPHIPLQSFRHRTKIQKSKTVQFVLKSELEDYPLL